MKIREGVGSCLTFEMCDFMRCLESERVFYRSRVSTFLQLVVASYALGESHYRVRHDLIMYALVLCQICYARLNHLIHLP